MVTAKILLPVAVIAVIAVLIFGYLQTSQEQVGGTGPARKHDQVMLAAARGLLPLAYGIGSGAERLRPPAVAVVGALCITVLLSLIATAVAHFIRRNAAGRLRRVEE